MSETELVVLHTVYTLLSHRRPPVGQPPRVSLVALANEIQSSPLVRQLRLPATDINSILQVIRSLFPGHATSLLDGQLSFHHLQMSELEAAVVRRQAEHRGRTVAVVARLEESIARLEGAASANATTATTTTAASGRGGGGGGGGGDTKMVVVDPRRDKLLQLYRDTVLKRLQGRQRVLDRLFEMQAESGPAVVSRRPVALVEVKEGTPGSVQELQLVLQRSVADAAVGAGVGSEQWRFAQQVQQELDETVQFMRRALE